jgi:hypothetical protein
MNVTVVGTGNMARAIGRRLVAGRHDVTVLGKQTADAEAVVRNIGSDGSANAGRSGEVITATQGAERGHISLPLSRPSWRPAQGEVDAAAGSASASGHPRVVLDALGRQHRTRAPNVMCPFRGAIQIGTSVRSA